MRTLSLVFRMFPVVAAFVAPLFLASPHAPDRALVLTSQSTGNNPETTTRRVDDDDDDDDDSSDTG